MAKHNLKKGKATKLKNGYPFSRKSGKSMQVERKPTTEAGSIVVSRPAKQKPFKSAATQSVKKYKKVIKELKKY